MCSTFLEAMASRRLARVMLPVLPAKTVPRGTRSRIFGGAITRIRRGPQRRSPFHHGCRLTGRLSRKRRTSLAVRKPFPPGGGAPHFAGLASGGVIKQRHEATAIPVAREKPDPLARH